MQIALLALTIWCFSYYPRRSGARGRHAARTSLKASLPYTTQRLPARPSYRQGGRHRAVGHQARRPFPYTPRKQAADDCGRYSGF